MAASGMILPTNSGRNGSDTIDYCLTGAILGDIAGGKYKDGRPYMLDPNHALLFTAGCCFTGNTVQALAAKIYMTRKNEMSMEDALRYLCRMYCNRQYGDLFERWFSDPESEPYGSWGSGAIVRMAYPVDICGDSRRPLDAMVDEVTLCTHNSDDALAMGSLAAEMAWMALHDYSMREIKEVFYRQFPEQKGKTIKEDYRDYYPRRDAINNLQLAAQCFFESHDFNTALRNTLRVFCDVPAVASITGMLAGAYYREFPTPGIELIRGLMPAYLYDIYQKIVPLRGT